MKKILIIEDDKFIADLYSHVLKKSGFAVEIASTATQGLADLKEGEFDLLLLDILLPDMNGLEVLRRWKETNPTTKMVIIMLTNLGQDEVAKEGFKLGVSGYLIKSALTPQQILEQVKSALGIS